MTEDAPKRCVWCHERAPALKLCDRCEAEARRLRAAKGEPLRKLALDELGTSN